VQFTTEGFQVHMLDMRNHGRSIQSEEFSYKIMAKDIYDYCQANNLKQYRSYRTLDGRKTAMLFAATHPEIVDKMIIADIGPKFYPQHHQSILAGLNAVNFSTKPSRSAVEAILSEYI
jgi:pimeloyl-ACP methyl ester carboxylesterase